MLFRSSCGPPARAGAGMVLFGSLSTTMLAPASTGGRQAFDEGARSGFGPASIVSTVLVLVLQLGYLVVGWSSGGGATPAMRLPGLRVAAAADGRPLSPVLAIRRWLAMGSWVSLAASVPPVAGLASLVLLIWSLVLLVSTASSSSHQGVHDLVATSVVVQRAGASNTGWIVGCVAVVVVLGLLGILSIVALVFLGGQVSTILSTVGESI